MADYDVVDRKYSFLEVMHNKEFNAFLDGLMRFPEITRITLADHLLETGWDDCDLDLDIVIKGGRVSIALGKFLIQYPKVPFIKVRNKRTGQLEIDGHHGSRFCKVGPYYLEISWGQRPFSVPYMVLRERGLKKKKWLP